MSESLRPTLSIVIGSNNACSTVAECLRSLDRQRSSREVEIIVVDNSTDGTAEIVSNYFPAVRLVRCPDVEFIPELWENGINRSTGDIVSLTSAHCIPNDDWIEEIIEAHRSSYPGVGGAIENHNSASIVDWAIYLLRYTPYMLPFTPGPIHDIAGDNASYKRWALDRFRDARRKGFWEPVVHAELTRAGFALLKTPRIVVRHKKSFTLWSFMKQRFWHGRQFGSSRSARISVMKRAAYIVLSPLIPLAFLMRISRQLITKRRHIGRFISSLPVLMLFLLSWTTGEFTGYLWAGEKQ
jgi:glycosyltransferase involved in cell wall biosynthesis